MNSVNCKKCGKTLASRQSLWNHKEHCKARREDSGSVGTRAFHSTDDTDLVSIPPLTPHTYRVDSRSGFSLPTPKRYSASVGTKRSSLARMIEKVREEEHVDRFKPIVKRRCRVRSTIAIPNCGKNNASLDSDKLGYETNNEASDSDELDPDETSKHVGADGFIHTNLINTNWDDDKNSESSEEDSDQENEDADKVWLLIAQRSCFTNCDALSSFKFFVKLCQALKQDRVLRIIMKTIQTAKDKYGMKFKEAVDYSVDKQKGLIYDIIDSEESYDEDSSNDASDGDHDDDATESDGHHTIDDAESSSDIPDSDDDMASDGTDNDIASSDNENDDYDEIWTQLYDDATKLDADILNIVASYIRLCHALKHDPVYQAVMETVDHAMHINKAKTFNNVLEVAIETRKFLILQATEEAMRVACNEGKTWAIASTKDDG